MRPDNTADVREMAAVAVVTAGTTTTSATAIPILH